MVMVKIMYNFNNYFLIYYIYIYFHMSTELKLVFLTENL